MSEQKKKEAAGNGGREAHRRGTAYKFTSEKAREAGSKGGRAAHAKGTAHRFTKEKAREAALKAAQSRREKKAKAVGLTVTDGPVKEAAPEGE